jgi:Uma2 family endonuclease
MRMESVRKLFTADDVVKMAEAGLFGDDERIELIDGEIVEMTPVGARHMGCVNRATAFMTEAFGRKAIVSIQNAMRLNIHNMPQPDVVILKPRADFYVPVGPNPENVLFLVEISDSTLRRDRNVKLPRYAKYGIPEVWIEDLKRDVILVFRDPKGDQYQTQLTFRHGDTISPLAFPKSTFRVDDLIGEKQPH